jgi:HEAT repeat protein
MKRYSILLLVNFITLTAFAEEALEFYSNELNNALTVADQLSILRIVRDAELEDSASFYASALSRLLTVYPNIRNNQELDAADECMRLLTDQLSEAQYTEAGQDLWRVVQVVRNPLVKSDALIALGKVGATDLLPQVVQTLLDTNAEPISNRLSGERIAYGAILSLENYKDPTGYLPVFFAAHGWYSQWVRTQAETSLPLIAEDPSEALIEVIHRPGYGYTYKYLALRSLEASEIADESKVQAALAGLYEGWRASTNVPQQQRDLVSMRKLAIDMITRYGIEDETVYPLLERSYKKGVDEEERIGAIGALSKIGTEDATKLLVSFIALMNNSLERGILTQQDERFLRVLLPALGATGQTVGEPVLQQVLAHNWTKGIHTLAQEALDSIGD